MMMCDGLLITQDLVVVLGSFRNGLARTTSKLLRSLYYITPSFITERALPLFCLNKFPGKYALFTHVGFCCAPSRGSRNNRSSAL